MRTPGWVFPVVDDTYLSPIWAVNSMEHFAQDEISFEFYDTYEVIGETGVVSDPVDPTTISGFISFNGKSSENGMWQPIASSVDLNNPLSILFSGMVYQLQAITSGISGCNYIQIYFDRERGSA